jgi:hypothetical protein
MLFLRPGCALLDLSMTRLLHLAAITLLAAAVLPAQATTYSTDHTDLWFNPSESGWGLNLIQQNQTMFGTLFVYDTTTAPHWYVASDLEPGTSGSQTSWQGTLFSTTGPFFGATSFNPSSVISTVVGTMTINFTSDTTATLIYTINGAVVSKNIQRQTFRGNVLTGNYIGGLTALSTNCHGTFDGTAVTNGAVLIFDLLTVTHTNPQSTPSQVSMRVDFQPDANSNTQSSCTLAGAYVQSGKVGAIASGSWNCTVKGQSANVGTFTMTQIMANTNGFNAKFHGTDQFCTYDGQFGGVLDVPLS